MQSIFRFIFFFALENSSSNKLLPVAKKSIADKRRNFCFIFFFSSHFGFSFRFSYRLKICFVCLFFTHFDVIDKQQEVDCKRSNKFMTFLLFAQHSSLSKRSNKECTNKIYFERQRIRRKHVSKFTFSIFVCLANRSLAYICRQFCTSYDQIIHQNN